MVPRPLVLRSQVGRSGKLTEATHLPVARVLVDTGVFHLDLPFDYLVPEEFSESAQLGVRVEVPFGAKVCEGIILERASAPERSGMLKQISKVLSEHPIATEKSLEIIDEVAKRWAANKYDVLRSAVPPRVQSVDRAFVRSGKPFKTRLEDIASDIPLRFSQPQVRAFWAMPPDNNFFKSLIELIRLRSFFGQVLVVVPDEWSLDSLFRATCETLSDKNCLRLDAQIRRSDRYHNFLKVMDRQANVIFGMRGAVFSPLIDGSSIIVVSESSHHLYEKRSPGWNARDVAILRAQIQHTNLILVGFSPSLEAARLIDSSFLTLVSSKQRRPTLAVDSANGELLPSKVFSFVRLAVLEGAVLFLVPSKGYGNAVLCGKCRNVALCNCGGKLHKRSAQSDPECAICTAQFPDWRCNWCQSSQIYITSRGIDRFAEEIGRAFPNHPIVNSSGDHIIRELSAAPSLVVATPGAVPRVELGYAGAVLLQGMRFFGHSDLRSNERAKDLFFETASLISSKGKVCVVIDPGHPIVAALNRWDPTVMARKELLEQEEAHLPPYWRIAVLEIQSTEAMGIVHGLTKARTEKRLPTSTQVMGPFEFASGSSRITLSSPQEDAPEMINFVHELQRKRSISGKSLFTVRVDPYTLG